MTKKDFIKNLKIKKAINGYSASFKYGDKLEMNSCIYKVIKCQDKGYTILEDEKNGKIAVPTDKILLLAKNGYIKSDEALKFTKAQSSIKTAHVSSSGSSNRGAPVGTISQGSDGQSYKKISSNPAKWVHVHSGSHHAEPGGPELHPLHHVEDMKSYNKVMDKVYSKTNPNDHKKLERLFMDFFDSLKKFKNLRDVHNTQDLDPKGRVSPKQAIPKSEIARIHNLGELAREKRKDFILAVKNSRSKLRSS